MEKLSVLLTEYGQSHQNPTNQKIHKICVPAIMWSLLGLLDQIPGPLNWSYVLVGGALLYYAQFQNFSVYKVVLIQAVPMLASIHFLHGVFDYRHWFIIFVAAWMGQFIGHKIEGKKPSFFQDIFFLLIGPLWILKGFLKL